MSHFSPIKGYVSASGTAVPSGLVGQIISTTVLQASAVALVTATPKNIMSVSLTPGLYDISGYIMWSGTASAANTMGAAITSTSATLNVNDGLVCFDGYDSSALSNTYGLNGNPMACGIPIKRVSVSSTTTYYLVARANFGLGTVNCSGWINAIKLG